ncbi:MAG: tRNA pseudouridine(55) synthase TruB [Treponema sp.]|nr:tRNA pseudouridine(55) synthase TruB [Treponema sp.]
MSHTDSSGLILLNKPPGITSFDALRDIKRFLGTGKVGHTGTLDKFAQGLLLVLAGSALKLVPWFTHCDKQYTGRIRFGIETDTLDPQGEQIARADIPSREEAEKALAGFSGGIMQTPPAYSAIHINGKRASELARSGQILEMKQRQVNIYKLELRLWEPPFADIFVHCSSGTYIRSLARDIAIAAGSRGHLVSLVRTQVSGFKLPDGNEQLETGTDFPLPGLYSLLPINKDVIKTLGLPWFELAPCDAEKLIHGRFLDPILNDRPLFSCAHQQVNSLPNMHAAVFCGETLTAVVSKKDGKWKYGCVFAEKLPILADS